MFLDKMKTCVILLQETMTNAGSACEYFLKLKPAWRVSSWYSNGLSGGTLVAWNPQVTDLKAFITTASIMVEGHIKLVTRWCS